MLPARTIITAGPTQEPIDEVRYLSNRSSGRLGIALALESARRGWPTTLLLGPVGSIEHVLREPDRDATKLDVVRFRTASDLESALRTRWPQHDLLIMAAAVADWRPVAPVAGKLRREGTAPPSIALERVPDLLAGLAELTRGSQVVVGFALEPAERLRESALEKLRRKRLDAVVANPLTTMDASDIEPTLLLADGRALIPNPARQRKEAFAAWLLDHCAELLETKRVRPRPMRVDECG